MTKVHDWSKIDFEIHGIDEQREVLETIVDPLLTTRKTGDVILFRGKRRYLKPLKSIANRRWQLTRGFAVPALQFLYKLERAVKKGDADEIIRSALGYAVHILHFGIAFNFNIDLSQAAMRTARRSFVSAKGGKATTKWTPDVERKAREIFRDVKREKVSNDAAYRRTSARLKSELGISLSKDTVKRHLSKPVVQR